MEASKADLDAIRERAEAATPGPWEADRPQVWGPNDESVAFVTTHDPGEGSGQPEWEANTVFIAHAREDVPALLDHVVRLEQRVRARDITIQTLSSVHANRIDAVRELHTLYTDHRELQWCHHCETPWPCETIQALEGDPDA